MSLRLTGIRAMGQSQRSLSWVWWLPILHLRVARWVYICIEQSNYVFTGYINLLAGIVQLVSMQRTVYLVYKYACVIISWDYGKNQLYCNLYKQAINSQLLTVSQRELLYGNWIIQAGHSVWQPTGCHHCSWVPPCTILSTKKIIWAQFNRGYLFKFLLPNCIFLVWFLVVKGIISLGDYSIDRDTCWLAGKLYT